MFGCSLGQHVLPYFVDYSRTGSGCALEQARLSLCGWQMRYVISWHSFQVALTHDKHDTHGTKRIARKSSLKLRSFRAKMRSWQKLVTSSYSIRTSPIKQSSVCHADRIHLLHVTYTEQSAHQTRNTNIDI